MSEEKQIKSGFFTRLLSFIVGHEVGSANKGTKILKSIQKQLNKSGYKFFNLKKDLINAQFAKFVYQVYSAVAPLREFFIQNTQDEFYAAQLLNYSLNADQHELVAKLSSQSIQVLATKIELKSLAEQGMNFFVALRDGLENEKSAEINDTYNALVLLKQFCVIDYYAGLRKFHGVFRENSFEEIPHFDAVPNEYMKEFVIDFLTATSLLLSVQDWGNVFAFLKNLSGIEDQAFLRLKQQIAVLHSMENSRVFVGMIKLVSHDPDAELQENTSSKNIVKPYLEGIYQEFRSTVEEIHHKRVIESQKKLVDDVFAGHALVPLKFYNEKENEKYVESDAHYFEHCNAFLYLNSFFALYFREEFTKFIENFEIIAQCNRPNYISDFTSLYHELNEMQAAVTELDTKLDTKFAEGYKLNSLYLRLGVNDSIVANFNMEIDSINMKVRAIIERSLKALQKILVFYDEMIHERSRGTFDIISNWDELNNKFENGCLPLLKRTKNHISTFLALMKNFRQLE